MIESGLILEDNLLQIYHSTFCQERAAGHLMHLLPKAIPRNELSITAQQLWQNKEVKLLSVVLQDAFKLTHFKLRNYAAGLKNFL